LFGALIPENAFELAGLVDSHALDTHPGHIDLQAHGADAEDLFQLHGKRL